MFKKAKKAADAKPADARPEVDEPVKSAMQIEAERAIARGARIAAVSKEVEMWRKFERGCKAGRFVLEQPSYYIGLDGNGDSPSMLSTFMDSDTAPLWAAFARQMGDERERRLKDILA